MSSNIPQSPLGDLKDGLIFILSAPAGTGKTTLVQKLVQEFPNVVQSISTTTRPLRQGEIPGIHYHFVSEADFQKAIEDGEFLEYVKLYGYYYGTSLKWITDQQKSGKHVVLVIDTQGAKQLMGKLLATFIFVLPPSLDVLKERLIRRNTEESRVIEKRLAIVEDELKAASLYDYHLINDDLEVAYDILRSIVIAEVHKNRGKSHQEN
ncbi:MULTISPECIES: guanylate kinase [Parachlamydia]|uniref:Guanylate kinase n=2 Tax=Parachlamydia acanthamoebae TaxID=83552 RepID=F8L0R6_PARAV|nr:guanylate kinase [Parachlamydia acanthamoebae]KIA77502.1 Guanylate kinase [Parachlamydia acanthamoebae]CCB86816.1 guanylate kinase [Parachlamydia acanthamoebae UV-7]